MNEPISDSAFVWPLRVYYEDTDALGMVYYANYLKYFERARTEWLRAMGFELDVLASARDLAFVVRRAEIDYRGSARFNQLLEVRSSIAELGRASVTFTQLLIDEDGQRLSEGRVQVACIHVSSGRPAKIPEDLQQSLVTFQRS
ncbi:MAG: tol-pal system-associated acyl-CoA thioesterase [Pseudomonadales bacterium]